jgi:hypothetical protein
MDFILGCGVWLVDREKSDSEAGFRILKASERGNEMWHGLGLNWGLSRWAQRNNPIVWIVKGISENFFALKFWRAKNGWQQVLVYIASGQGLWDH